MNAKQRTFLIEKIQGETKEKISLLEKKLLEAPSANNWLFNAIMSDRLEIQSKEHILAALKKKALNCMGDKNWLSNDSNGFGRLHTIKFDKLTDVMVMPDDFAQEQGRVKEHNKSIYLEIDKLKVGLNTIEMRIQLASDSVLRALVNQIDDMGDIMLIDTTVKLLSNGDK